MRAKDYNEKKKRLKILKEKAAERNPDEFHFAMMSSKTHSGGQKVGDRGNKVLSHDAVKLYKTQDAGYLRTMAQKTRFERERMEQEYLLEQDVEAKKTTFKLLKKTPGTIDSNRVVFVDSKVDQQMYDKDSSLLQLGDSANKHPRLEAEDDSEDMADDDGRNRSKSASGKGAIDDRAQLREARALRKRRARALEARKVKLAALKEREDNLNAAERELETQRGKMNNSIGGVTKAGVKFKVRERKR